MITLESVKAELRLDFPDQDELIQSYIDAVKDKAYRIIGCSIDTPELDAAMIKDIAYMYANSGQEDTSADSSFYTYKRLSKRPMF